MARVTLTAIAAAAATLALAGSPNHESIMFGRFKVT